MISGNGPSLSEFDPKTAIGFCLEETGIPRCGNARVESDEECDCGRIDSCNLVDACCTPMGQMRQCKVKEDREDRGRFQCSPSQGPCCNRTCQFIQGGECQPPGSDLCRKRGTCGGNKAECVPSELKSNGTPCLMTYMTCFKGECINDICKDNNMTICDCKGGDIERCEVCCESSKKQCKPASDHRLLFKDGRKALQLVGTICKEGFICSTDGECLELEQMLKVQDEDYRPGIIPYLGKGIQWLANNWLYFILASIIGISMFGYAFGFSYRRSRDSHAKAFAEKLKQAKALVDLSYPEFEKGRHQEHRYKTLCRLVALFPNLPIHKLRKVVKKHKNEHDAFHYIVSKGQGIKYEG